MATLKTKIKIRRDTAANLANVVLEASEPAYATDTKKFAIGDGSTKFSDLKGRVIGPNTSTDNALVRFDGTSGQIIQNSGIIVDDNNNLTTKGLIKIQNGSASGAFVLGADVNATTLTASQRKLGRMGVPSYDSTTKTIAGISFDSQKNVNLADFGGHPNNTSSIAPDVIRFIVANSHDNEVAGARTLALQISKQDGLVDIAGGGTSVAAAKFFIPVQATSSITGNEGFIHGGLTAATGKTKNDYILLAGGSTKPISDFALATDIPDVSDFVTKSTAQEITGKKTFIGQHILKSSAAASSADNAVSGVVFHSSGDVYNGKIAANDAGAIGFYGRTALYFRPVITNGAVDVTYGVTMNSSGLYPGSSKMNLGTSSYQWGSLYATTIYENGTSLASKYLGISAKAADSDKLDGQDSAYYLNYNNLTNKPTIPNPEDYYWANVKVSKTSSTSTAPAFSKIIVNDANATNHITFQRSGWSYVAANASTSAAIAFIAGNTATAPSGANASLAIKNTVLLPGLRDNEVSLGGAHNSTIYHFKDLYLKGKIYNGDYNYTLPSKTGTLALTSDIPTDYVAGPTESTDNAIARYDGATGKKLDNSKVTIADTGSITIGGTWTGTSANNPFLSMGGYAKLTANTAGAFTLSPSNTTTYLATTTEFRPVSEKHKLVNLGSASYYWNNIYGTVLYEDGASLSTKYLGIKSKAADSDKLDGQDSTYYLNYNNLTNKPTIPTVNDGTLTIQRNGTTIATFTANQSGNTTANITDNDTLNTAGSTNDEAKLYLVGAKSQATSAQTYSDAEVYTEAGELNATSVCVAEHGQIKYDSATQCIRFVIN